MGEKEDRRKIEQMEKEVKKLKNEINRGALRTRPTPRSRNGA